MLKLTLLLPALLGAALLTGCVEEGTYRGDVAYHGGDAYYDDGYDSGDVDFVYVESRPYSRSYGPLYARNGGYYYSRGGEYYVYDRGEGSRRRHYSRSDSRDYGSDSRHYRSGSHDSRSSFRTYISPQQRAENQAQITQYRNQQAVQKYREQQLYDQNRAKISQYRYQAQAQQAQNEQQLRTQRNQYAYQQKVNQYQQKQAIQQYRQTHPQPKSKKKKED